MIAARGVVDRAGQRLRRGPELWTVARMDVASGASSWLPSRSKPVASAGRLESCSPVEGSPLAQHPAVPDRTLAVAPGSRSG